MTHSPVPPPLPKRSASLTDYLKRAFLYRWNLLLFFGGTAAAFLTPWPDALLPLVAAAEVTYLGGVISLPRFRATIDAQIHKEAKTAPAPAGVSRTLHEILATLPPESRRRFETVRARCLEMRAIASGVRGRAGTAVETGQELSTSTLDRLLWVFLRLLVSRESLSRFLDRTDAGEIRARHADLKTQIERYAVGDERVLRSLQDSLAAQELRLQNYTRAESNHEYVRIELDRIEAKIQALAESSVNRQDPDFLSSQIDSVTESMQSTEKAISELEHITGLVDEMQEPPAILESDLGKVTGS
jgi:hypothetical protein